MKNNHPYKHHEGTPLWTTVEAAIRALVENGDIAERTTHEHIVGYLCKAISDAQQSGSN
jgi:hypothetical protein